MLWSVISCVSHASKQSALKEYDIDIQQRDAISDFVDSYKTLPLETTKDNLIGNINKVQIIDTCIYVLDKEQATIFVFNTEGKYLNKICRQGRSPRNIWGFLILWCIMPMSIVFRMLIKRYLCIICKAIGKER